MSTFWYALNIPLALLAGAAAASNPRWFPVGTDSSPGPSPVETVRAAEKSRTAVELRGRLGPETPELRALRLAEEQLFNELETEGLGFDSPEDIQAFASSADILQGLNQPNIPVSSHDSVRRYVDFFSSSEKGRQMFSTWLKRSGRYRAIIGDALRKKGLPSDLEAMVFVESGFWPTAKSSAGAVGLWQFMPATARAYGLTVNSTFDERRSPWRASEAAAEHLADLYGRFKSWDLALASYNFGYQNVERRMSESEITDFWDVVDREGILPEETRRYVPKIHAVAVILNNLDHFGFQADDLDEALRAAAFEVPPGTSLTSLARASGTSVAQFRQLNPEFLANIIPDRGGPVVVHVPSSNLARARIMLPRLLGGELRELPASESGFFNFGGDDEEQLRLQKTVVTRQQQREDVANLDGSRSQPSRMVEPEQSTKSTDGSFMSEPESLMSTLNKEENQSQTMSKSQKLAARQSALTLAFIQYRVGQGDSLSDLAKRFGVSERELILDNGIRNRSIIYRGQKLKIRDAKQSPSRDILEYEVMPGDSLGEIAQRHRESVAKLAKVNELSDPDLLRIGQIVRIPPS